MRSVAVVLPVVALAGLAADPPNTPPRIPLRQMERLDRGLVALPIESGKVYLGWRLLGTDPETIAFNVYRATGDGQPVKLNVEPVTTSTNLIDAAADLTKANTYTIHPIFAGKEQHANGRFTLPVNAPARGYLSIPTQVPAGYSLNDAAAADLDGDGAYELVVKVERRGFDNSRRGVCPGTTKLHAYKLDGTLLWTIDLGRNIREGAHYTPFIVYDFDGDGRAELAVRTAEGTTDGAGTTIGDTDGDGRTDYVNPETGYILEGPEFLSVFDGKSGKELARTPYIPRGKVADWGDHYGNRVDRFLMGVGYFDGERPSILMCRGYYARTALAAIDWRNGKLTTRWTFDTRGRADLKDYEGQGNHNLALGDLDGDGKDEVVYGSMVLGPDGAPRHTTRLGHGDAMHLSDIDPDRPGLEIFAIHERARHPNAAELRDARTGTILWGKAAADVGRGVAMDIDPRHKGYETWASGSGLTGVWNVKGQAVSERKPRSCNFGVWWDADPLRELLDRTTISKWNWKDERETVLITATGCSSNNGSKATPCLCSDLLGDWREEVVWPSADNRELRIYTTTIPTDRRLVTLMHDPIYRLSSAAQNAGYNQPTQPGFYLGHGMTAPPRPAIRTTGPTR